MDKTCLRGLFDKDDDSVHPLVDNSIFKACPNGMRFDTKEVRCALKPVKPLCVVRGRSLLPLMPSTYKTTAVVCV